MSYAEELHRAVTRRFCCAAVPLYSALLQEYDASICNGRVTVFELKGHPLAARCYAWGLPQARKEEWEITLVLEIPPVRSVESAVRFARATRLAEIWSA